MNSKSPLLSNNITSKIQTVLLSIVLCFLAIVITQHFFRLLEPIVFKTNHFMGYDTELAAYSMKTISFQNKLVHKHLFFSISYVPLVTFISTLLFVNKHTAILYLIQILAALHMLIVFNVLRSKMPKITAFLFSLFYLFVFINTINFSVPETYLATNTFILLFFLLFFHGYNNPSSILLCLLTLIIGIGMLFNPPLGLLIIPLWFLMHKKYTTVKAVFLGLGSLVFVLLFFLLPYALIFGRNFLVHFSNNASKYTSLSNIFSLGKILNVLSGFFIFSIVAPGKTIPRECTFLYSDYFNSPIKTALLCMLISLILIAVFFLVKNHRTFYLALLSWIFSLTIFHCIFNPDEAIIYSPQIMLIVTFLLGAAFNALNAKGKHFLFLLFLVFLFYNNYAVIKNTRVNYNQIHTQGWIETVTAIKESLQEKEAIYINFYNPVFLEIAKKAKLDKNYFVHSLKEIQEKKPETLYFLSYTSPGSLSEYKLLDKLFFSESKICLFIFKVIKPVQIKNISIDTTVFHAHEKANITLQVKNPNSWTQLFSIWLYIDNTLYGFFTSILAPHEETSIPVSFQAPEKTGKHVFLIKSGFISFSFFPDNAHFFKRIGSQKKDISLPGRSYIQFEKENPHHDFLMYGPYEYYPPGEYKAFYIVRTSSKNTDNIPFAICDIVSDGGNVVYGKTILENTLLSYDNKFSLIEVPFKLKEQTQLEFRLQITGSVDLACAGVVLQKKDDLKTPINSEKVEFTVE